MHLICSLVWRTEETPLNSIKADIVQAYERKDIIECENYYRISLLSIHTGED